MARRNDKEIFRYYSQHGEDYLLWEFFDHKPEGCFIEVGAFDGVYLSNTWSFEQMGWKGICVEPQKIFHEMCRQNRKNSVSLNMACVGDESARTVKCQMEKSGLLSSICDSEGYQRILREYYENLGTPFEGTEKITVEAATLNKIISENLPEETSIDFISIDVEGHEADVLQGFDTERFKPRVIIVEANSPAEESKMLEIIEEQRHYLFARKLGVNMLFARREVDRQKLQSIPVNCFIEKQTHPLGTVYSSASFVKGVMLTETKDIQLEKRLELLQRNGTNWIQCKREIERLSSKNYLFEQFASLLGNIREIQARHPRYLISGTGAIGELVHALSPASTIAFIDKERIGECFGGVPVINPKEISQHSAPVLITEAKEEKELVQALTLEHGLPLSKILTIEVQ